jgi:hypothetical protein
LASLKLLSEFLDNKSFTSMTREDIVSYLDNLRKVDQEDVLHKWVGTYNIKLALFTGFFKWLYYNDIEASRRPKPQLLGAPTCGLRVKHNVFSTSLNMKCLMFRIELRYFEVANV